MQSLNETHDPVRRSWVKAANESGCDFPIQNLPFGIFQAQGREWRGGIAIGDMILDIKAAVDGNLFSQDAHEAARAACKSTLNELMAMPSQQISILRHELSDLLRSGGPNQQRIQIMAPELLVPMHQASYSLPSVIGGFTDFFTSVDHVARVGRIVRPDTPLPGAFKHLPMAYNGRASSVVMSGTPVVRPCGQRKSGDAGVIFAPTRALDYELEVGFRYTQ